LAHSRLSLSELHRVFHSNPIFQKLNEPGPVAGLGRNLVPGPEFSRKEGIRPSQALHIGRSRSIFSVMQQRITCSAPAMASSASLRGASLRSPLLAPRPAVRRAPTARRRAVPAKISCIGWVRALLSLFCPAPTRGGTTSPRRPPAPRFLTLNWWFVGSGGAGGRTRRAYWARRRAGTSRASSSAAASRGTPRRARRVSARCARRRSAAAASAR